MEKRDGLIFLVMELIDGRSLDKAIVGGRRMDWREATRVIRDAAAGLAAAHEIGGVHRDGKPANLMQTSKGLTKVVDFGLARAAQSNTQLTQQGKLRGTPSYMAPEVWSGGEADARSDLYSLICTYYHLLTGQVPFDAPVMLSLGYQHRHEPFPDPRAIVPDLPDAVCRILARGSQKEPAKRYQSAGELLAELEALLASPPESVMFGSSWGELGRNTGTASEKDIERAQSMTLNALAGWFPDASIVRAFFAGEEASHRADSSRSDRLADITVILLWLTLVYPVWLYPVVHGVRCAKRAGISPHWMWFGIHPLTGWIAFGIISLHQDSQFTPASGSAPPPGGLSESSQPRIQPRTFFKSFALVAIVTSVLFAAGTDSLMAIQLADNVDKFGDAFLTLLPVCLGAGAGFGIFFGLAMAPFIKGTATSIPFERRDLFTSSLRIALAGIGYAPESEKDDVLVYKPTIKAGLLSGKIQIQFMCHEARIVGHRWHLRKLSRVIQGQP